jgi:hypothetical protein
MEMRELLTSEQRALDFISHYGRDRVTKVLNSVCNRIQRRINIGNATSFGQFFDEGNVKYAQWERDVIYMSKLALMLTNTDSPASAHARIIERRRQQREAALARRSAKAA